MHSRQNQESGDESGSSNEEFESSQEHSSTSKQWFNGNLASVNSSLPCDFLLGRANDARQRSLKFDFVRKALLNYGVDVIVDQVQYLVLNADCLFMSVHIMTFLRK